MFKSISKYTYFSFIPFTLLGVITLLLLITKIIPVYYLWFTLIGWTLIAGLGVEVGFHRIFTHNSVKHLSVWLENIILFLGCLGGQGSSITWVAVHRQHHKFSDKDEDLHSPITHTKWHSFFGWTKNITENNNPIKFKYVVDLLKKPNHVWFHKHQLSLLWIVPMLVALYDWKLSLALICLPIAITIIVGNSVNVICHGNFIGNYRNHNTPDKSYNNIGVALISWGLGYHNNHHYEQRLFFQKTKKWEIDPCIIFKPLLNDIK